jgi:hypothetical protein
MAGAALQAKARTKPITASRFMETLLLLDEGSKRQESGHDYFIVF